MEVTPRPIDLVQVLSHKGIDHVPLRFVQQPGKRPSTADLDPEHQGIPVLDLAGIEIGSGAMVMEDVARACEEWGFFQVINHGISASLIENVWKVVNGFLALPMEEKLKRPMKQDSSSPNHPTGYGRLFDFSENTILDWVDALIHYFAPVALVDMDCWPESPANYRETMEAYGKEMQRLVKVFLQTFSRNLGLHSNHLEKAFGGDDAQFILRVNHYPPCPQPNLVMGLSPHSDGSAVTILLHDEVEGLQIRKEGRWHTVKPLPNALIVNLGDMMQLISNGKYKSMEHRAVVSSERERKSIVTFFAPSLDAVINPIVSASETGRPLYRSIKFADFLLNYMTSDLNGKARIEALLLDEQ